MKGIRYSFIVLVFVLPIIGNLNKSLELPNFWVLKLEATLGIPVFFLNLIQRIGLLALAAHLGRKLYKQLEWLPWTKVAYTAYVLLLLPDLQQMLHFFVLGYPFIGLFGIGYAGLLLAFPLYKLKCNEASLFYAGALFLMLGLVLKLSFAEASPLEMMEWSDSELEARYFESLRWREIGAVSFVFSAACLISGLFQGIISGMENRTLKTGDSKQVTTY